jgi:prepilin-type N-terminal cleavage/methylation domain-containing protein
MNWRDRSGLSLLELLIALALLAVISAALATTTNFGVQLLNRTEQLSSTNTEIALRIRLRRWMERAAGPQLIVGFPTTFSGTQDRVEFVTLAPAPFAPDSAALRIILQTGTDTLNLQINEVDDTGTVLTNHNRVLATEIRNISFSYYSTDPDIAGWHDTWTDETALPALVRITADQGSTPSWPEFTVRLIFAQTDY